MEVTSLEFSTLRTAMASAYARVVSHEAMHPKSTTLTVLAPRHMLYHARLLPVSPPPGSWEPSIFGVTVGPGNHPTRA